MFQEINLLAKSSSTLKGTPLKNWFMKFSARYYALRCNAFLDALRRLVGRRASPEASVSMQSMVTSRYVVTSGTLGTLSTLGTLGT
jgi:hypothetical protein